MLYASVEDNAMVTNKQVAGTIIIIIIIIIISQLSQCIN